MRFMRMKAVNREKSRIMFRNVKREGSGSECALGPKGLVSRSWAILGEIPISLMSSIGWRMRMQVLLVNQPYITGRRSTGGYALFEIDLMRDNAIWYAKLHAPLWQETFLYNCRMWLLKRRSIA
jgi:hypothetical protein